MVVALCYLAELRKQTKKYFTPAKKTRNMMFHYELSTDKMLGR